jgi:single-stranded DNA-binding protein
MVPYRGLGTRRRPRRKKREKGKRIAIDGSLRNNEWTDDKGQRHTVTEVLVKDLFLIDFEKE